MEHYATLSGALESFAGGAETFFIVVFAGLALYAAMVVAVILEINAWGRRTDKSAARQERRHQEYRISLAISRRRQREEHARRMEALNARQR